MNDIISAVSGKNIKLEVSSEDLNAFCNQLIKRAIEEVATLMQNQVEDRLMSKEEVMEELGVCDTTLWLWRKKNYLLPVRMGRKVFYHSSDVNRILNNKVGEK